SITITHHATNRISSSTQTRSTYIYTLSLHDALPILQGEYHWHKHDSDDEFFFVLEGHFIIDLEDRSVDLQPQQGFVVPKGVKHRDRKSTRLNSSHRTISYAVFCLKKKKYYAP